MPRYIYECGVCKEQLQISHSIKDTLHDCEKCGARDSLCRIPQLTMRAVTEKNSIKKPGDVVNEYIQTTKQEVREQKEVMTRERKHGS
mgnify:FL=1